MNDISFSTIADVWFRGLNKRNKLIILVLGNNNNLTDIKRWNNMELILQSRIEPKRRYIVDGVPYADYPSFDEVTDMELYELWNKLPAHEKALLYEMRDNNFY